MEARLEYAKASPEAYRAMLGLSSYLARCGLEKSLLELIKIRVSQINGCAFCLDMHTKDARALGETEQRIYMLSAWRETPFYTDRERVALAWAETLTHIGQGVSDAAFANVSQHFTEKEVVDLTWAIVSINGWNRVAISFRGVPGVYQPAKAVE